MFSIYRLPILLGVLAGGALGFFVPLFSAAADSGSGSGAYIVPDLTTDPGAFLQALQDVWTHGWGAVALLLAVGILEVLAWIGRSKCIPRLAWLGVGRVSLVLGGLTAITATAFACVMRSAQLSAVLFAGIMAGFAYWHNAPIQPEPSPLPPKA